MTDRPTTPEFPPGSPLAEYAARGWQIETYPAWIACRRTGTSIRVLAAFTASELAAKLEAAEQVEP